MKSKLIFLLIFCLTFNFFPAFSQPARIETCTSTIFLKTTGKKYFAVMINNIIIYDIPKDSLYKYFFLQKDKKRRIIHNSQDVGYEKLNIDTNNLILYSKTKKLLILNGKFYRKKQPLKRIKSTEVKKIYCMNSFESMKKFGWRRGWNGAIVIETKEQGDD